MSTLHALLTGFTNNKHLLHKLIFALQKCLKRKCYRCAYWHRTM